MFLVYDRETGELTYTADEEALQHLPEDRLGWIPEPEGNWKETHFWNPRTRSLVAFPTED